MENISANTNLNIDVYGNYPYIYGSELLLIFRSKNMAIAGNDRIDVRISKEQKELFKKAAELSGFKSLTEFIVFCVNAETSKVIKNNNEVLKSVEDQKIFVSALLNPATPNEKLKKAQGTYREFYANGIADRDA